MCWQLNLSKNMCRRVGRGVPGDHGTGQDDGETQLKRRFIDLCGGLRAILGKVAIEMGRTSSSRQLFEQCLCLF